MPVIVGVDIGGSKMLAGLVTLSGEPLTTVRVATRPESYMADLRSLVATCLTKADALGEDVAGIGVGTTGLVDYAQGQLTRSIGLGLSDLPIRPLLEEICGLPVYVDNDIHAAALGELIWGVGRRHDDFLLINAGTGVSVGIVLGKKLHRGASNVAGEFGHTSIGHADPYCHCGLPGCLEHNIVRARTGEKFEIRPLSNHAKLPPSAEYYFLALGVVNLVNLLNPEAIVLTGGMFTSNKPATSWVIEAVRAESLEVAAAALQHVGVSNSGKMAGLIGAAALVLEPMRANEIEVASHG